jgi:hypothetical protein
MQMQVGSEEEEMIEEEKESLRQFERVRGRGVFQEEQEVDGGSKLQEIGPQKM